MEPPTINIDAGALATFCVCTASALRLRCVRTASALRLHCVRIHTSAGALDRDALDNVDLSRIHEISWVLIFLLSPVLIGVTLA